MYCLSLTFLQVRVTLAIPVNLAFTGPELGLCLFHRREIRIRADFIMARLWSLSSTQVLTHVHNWEDEQSCWIQSNHPFTPHHGSRCSEEGSSKASSHGLFLLLFTGHRVLVSFKIVLATLTIRIMSYEVRFLFQSVVNFWGPLV